MAFDNLTVHHTGASVDIDRLLIDGRPDLAGPLCNVALHAAGDVALVASGRANHLGVGTWSSSRSLGVEATGPPFANYREYVVLAAGFCIWKGAPPTRVVRGDVPIPVYLIGAHKEAATFDDGSYGRKINPSGSGWHEGGRTIAGVRLIDAFRADVADAIKSGGLGVSQADVIAALKSTEGRDAVRMAVWGTLELPSVAGGLNAADVLEVAANGVRTIYNRMNDIAGGSLNREQAILTAVGLLKTEGLPMDDDQVEELANRLEVADVSKFLTAWREDLSGRLTAPAPAPPA